MPTWKVEPLIACPPLEEWPMFNLPWDNSVQRIDSIHMPNLKSLYCDHQTELSALPWNDLRTLNILSVYACGFKRLDLWRLPNLNNCAASENYSLVEVDAHDNTALVSMDLYYCGSLAYLNLQGCTKLRYLYAWGCALP